MAGPSSTPSSSTTPPSGRRHRRGRPRITSAPSILRIGTGMLSKPMISTGAPDLGRGRSTSYDHAERRAEELLGAYEALPSTTPYGRTGRLRRPPHAEGGVETDFDPPATSTTMTTIPVAPDMTDWTDESAWAGTRALLRQSTGLNPSACRRALRPRTGTRLRTGVGHHRCRRRGRRAGPHARASGWPEVDRDHPATMSFCFPTRAAIADRTRRIRLRHRRHDPPVPPLGLRHRRRLKATPFFDEVPHDFDRNGHALL